MQRLPGLDELRGIAILLVVVSHLQAAFGFEGEAAELLLGPAWGVGVDLFFVVSGLVVFRSLQTLREQRGAWDAASAFYVRRVARIVPLVWFVAAMLSVGLLLPASKIAPADVISALSFAGNAYWATCFAGIPSACGNPLGFGPFWSIATEMQFYVIAPLLVLVLTRRALIAVAALVLLVGLFLYRPWGGALWAFRLDAIAVGLAIGALIGSRPWEHLLGRQASIGNAEVIFWMAVAACLVAILPVVAQSAATVVVALICGMIVLRTILRQTESGAVGRGLAWIGRQSFALYLVHLPVMSLAGTFVAEVAGRTSAAVVGIGASMLIAWLLTQRIGDPLYEMGKAWTNARLVRVPR